MTDERTRRRFLAVAGSGTAFVLAGCVGNQRPTRTPEPPTERPEEADSLEEWDDYDPEWTAPTASPLQGIEYERVATGLKVPWDFTFAPNGDLFVSERIGRIVRIEEGESTVVARPAGLVRATAIDEDDEGGWWSTGGEGGLLGIAVHPRYPETPYVYAYTTYEAPEAPEGRLNRVVRFDVSGAVADGPGEPVVDGIPANMFHNGGRLAFGPRDRLWITNGDAGLPESAPDPASLVGSVLRVTPEGAPAPGNPDWDDGDPRVFTVGHRNPQAITWLPDGTPVVTEHGPSGRDEVNLLSAGDDYGWPDARNEDEYGEGLHPPVANTGGETWAPSGGVFYTGDAVPALRNRLLVGALRGQHVNAVTLSRPDAEFPPLDAETARRFEGWYDRRFVATSHRLFENELGRVRYVGEGPDGAPYAITSNRDGRSGDDRFPREFDDVLVRLVG
jgi:glucose/arabinose dehydrogenase